MERWPEEIPNLGEARIVWMLQQAGVTPEEIEWQFRLGRYRLDFAFVKERIAIESDGWVHLNLQHRRADRQRDADLRRWGWLTVRLNAEASIPELEGQLLSVLRVIRRLQRERSTQDQARELDTQWLTEAIRELRRAAKEPATGLGRGDRL